MLTLLREANVSLPCTRKIGLKTLHTLAQVCSMKIILSLSSNLTFSTLNACFATSSV